MQHWRERGLLPSLRDALCWHVCKEPSVRRRQLPNISAQRYVQAAEGPRRSVLPALLGAHVPNNAAKLLVHFGEQTGADHADLVDE